MRFSPIKALLLLKKVNIYLLSVNNGDELVIFDVLSTSAVFLFKKAKKKRTTKKMHLKYNEIYSFFLSKFSKTLKVTQGIYHPKGHWNISQKKLALIDFYFLE